MAAELFAEAVSRDPTHSNLVRIAGVFARHIGKMDGAIKLGRHSVAIDPLCFQCLYQLSRTYFYAGDYAGAEEMRARYLALGTGGKLHYALMKLLQGDYEGALALVESREDDPQVPKELLWGVRSMAYHSMGRARESEAALAMILELDDEIAKYWIFPDVYAWRGDSDEFFEIIFRENENDPMSNTGYVFRSQYSGLHSDPRWTEWREKIGMSEERLDAIVFDPQLPQ